MLRLGRDNCPAVDPISFRQRTAWALLVASILTSLCAPDSYAQRSLFGSVDDPEEQSNVAWWESYSEFQTAGGFSLIGPQWRTAGLLEWSSYRTNTSFRLSSTFRAGLYGAYEPDSDELYDLLRVVEFARYRPARGGAYVRIGPLDRARLGNGYLVNFLSTEASWDERTLGLEARFEGRYVALETISADISRAGLIGARLSLSPFRKNSSNLHALTLGVSMMQDRDVTLDNGDRFRGVEFDVRYVAFNNGGFDFIPFASFGQLKGFGQGILIGADLENDNFIDLARVHMRLALQYNSSDFLPGYFGSFYGVSNMQSRILENQNGPPVDVALRDVQRGKSVNTELRVLVFERFEFWYAFMRYHGVQKLSEYHLRLFFRTPRFTLAVGQDRRGLKGLLSLLGELGEENRMRFEFAYRVFSSFWVQFDAHYTYLRVTDTGDSKGYSIQRRFDPLMGLRVRF